MNTDASSNATECSTPSIALVIIDQQAGIDHPKLGERNNPKAEAHMLRLLAL